MKTAPPQLQVARLELDAHLALAAQDVKKSLKQFERAAKAERSLRYNEPPTYPRPVYEVLGSVALKHNRPDVSERAYRQALDQYPDSLRARTGLAQALRQAEKPIDAGL
jgi:predicted Zn-dependent protease